MSTTATTSSPIESVASQDELPAAAATSRPLSVNITALRQRFTPRPARDAWPATAQSRHEVLQRLLSPPFQVDSHTNGHQRLQVRSLTLILDWLESLPGATWQQRWLASGCDGLGAAWQSQIADWLRDRGERFPFAGKHSVLPPGMALLVGGDVLRPEMAWFLSQRVGRSLMPVLGRARDPEGFALLRKMCAADPGISDANGIMAVGRIGVIVAAKGGLVRDVTVGDCVELLDTQAAVHKLTGAGMVCFYRLLHTMGIFPDDAPLSIRMFRSPGQLTCGELVDRYRIACHPIRDLLVEYLRERQPAMDYSSLNHLAFLLAGRFWADLERHHPGIDSLHLPVEIAAAWKQRQRFKTITVTENGNRRESTVPRRNVGDLLTAVRAFYLDLAQWAAEDPARWTSWAVPCPIRAIELVVHSKEKRHRKSRMDTRTRERLPVLPTLVRHAENQRHKATTLLRAVAAAHPGDTVTVADQTLQRAVMIRSPSGKIFADDPTTGTRRDLSQEEHETFWTWAAVEVLRHTGIRIEELTELTHHSFVQYKLPTTGELVPLLQIVPSKTDAERLLLISPELADVLSAIITRIRQLTGAVPLVAAYDKHEKIWNPPMPLLFQSRFGTENRPVTGGTIRRLLRKALIATGLTDPDGQPLVFTPHDFRRMFITDAIMQGLPPHIAQVICGHRDINVTMGYKAVYPHEAIQAHRAFLDRRRATRPGEEYRTPTAEEWDAFLSHFEKRKVSLGTCGRAFGTPCIHEHACIRCSMLWPDPAQKPRLTEIRDNLIARIAEAEREGWIGEVDGLRISLTAAEHKLAQLDTATARRATVELGIPTLIAAR